MERITSQKMAILDYLKSVHTHPTAEEIYKIVKRKLPRISLGTVYRNLAQLSKKRQILEIRGEKKRFDALTSDHHHFFCQNCDRVYDLVMKIPIKTKKIKGVGYIKNYKIYFFGLCEKCQKK